ncbi:uncharacterized protein LOC6586428 [Drosophila mojavensis]|nr:uncharacterized protein LOC6586428 [Drosophila mojavensis]
MADAGEEEAPEGEAVETAEEDEKAEAAAEEQEEAVDEDKADESEVDPFELLDETSEDNEEEHRMYREYLDLTKEIDCQNAIINDLKERTRDLCENPCKTYKERNEIKQLLNCLDKEKIKLNIMINRAMQLQNFGSKRAYGAIELATTTIEENLLRSAVSCSKTIKCASANSKPKTAQEICDALDDSDSDSDDDCC